MRLHIKCPNCGNPSKAFKVRPMTEVVTEVAYNCNDIGACGSSFVVTVEVARYLRMPTFINRQINVPLSPVIQKRQIAEALERLRVADLSEMGEIVAPSHATRQRDIFDEMPLSQASGP